MVNKIDEKKLRRKERPEEGNYEPFSQDEIAIARELIMERISIDQAAERAWNIGASTNNIAIFVLQLTDARPDLNQTMDADIQKHGLKIVSNLLGDDFFKAGATEMLLKFSKDKNKKWMSSFSEVASMENPGALVGLALVDEKTRDEPRFKIANMKNMVFGGMNTGTLARVLESISTSDDKKTFLNSVGLDENLNPLPEPVNSSYQSNPIEKSILDEITPKKLSRREIADAGDYDPYKQSVIAISRDIITGSINLDQAIDRCQKIDAFPSSIPFYVLQLTASRPDLNPVINSDVQNYGLKIVGRLLENPFFEAGVIKFIVHSTSDKNKEWLKSLSENIIAESPSSILKIALINEESIDEPASKIEKLKSLIFDGLDSDLKEVVASLISERSDAQDINKSIGWTDLAAKKNESIHRDKDSGLSL